MARIRSIHPNACTSEKLAIAGAGPERFYWRLQTQCDDEGRAEDHPRLLHAAIFPLNDDETPETVESHLARLEEVGLLVRYVIDGRRFLQVTQFGEHQHPRHPSPSKIPAPPEDRGSVTADRGNGAADRRDPHAGEGVGDGGGEGEKNVVVPAAPGPVEAVFDAWKHATGKNGRTVLSDQRRKVIAKALKDYPVDEVIDAVRGWQHSAHHRGENDRHTVYNDLELLLRNSKNIENFRDLERRAVKAPPRMPPGADAVQRAVAARDGP